MQSLSSRDAVNSLLVSLLCNRRVDRARSKTHSILHQAQMSLPWKIWASFPCHVLSEYVLYMDIQPMFLSSMKQQETRYLGGVGLTDPSLLVWAAISKLRSTTISVSYKTNVSSADKHLQNVAKQASNTIAILVNF